MALTSDNINIIEQFADKLEKWTENLSYSTSPAQNLWVELTLSFYPQDVEVIVSRLTAIPALGQKVRKDFARLSQTVHKLDAWRAQKVYEEELVRFSALTDRLRNIALDIVLTVRKASKAGTSQPPSAEAATVEKSNASEIGQAKLAETAPSGSPRKPPRKEALMAYELHNGMGLTEPQVAKRMRGELMLDRPVKQWEVARWIRQVENWRTRTGLAVDSALKRLSRLDSNDLVSK